MAALPAVLHAWKTIQLDKLQRELDSTAVELTQRQDEAESSRKALVEQSKEFKQNAQDTVRRQVTPLLKSFQSEIDRLGTRSKAAETAFLQLYKTVVESPDPAPCLEQADQWRQKAQKAQDLELEVENLRKTLSQYNEEFAEVKNQEVTVRQLREKIRSYEEQIDSAVEDKVKERESQLRAHFERREHEMREAGAILSLKVQEADRRADALQKSLDAAQQELFTLRARSDDSSDARSSELDMLSADLDRANQRAEMAERQTESLKQQLIQAKEQQQTDNEQDRNDVSMEVELGAKDKQIAHLLEEVKQLNGRLEEEQTEWEQKMISAQNELERKTEALQLLETRLSTQADYEELRRELSIMKSIEFGAQSNIEEGKALEVLLLEKNKSLQAENTNLKVAKQQTEEARAPVPLQQMVEAVGCLVGAELVDSYNREASVDRDLHQQLERAQNELPSIFVTYENVTPTVKIEPLDDLDQCGQSESSFSTQEPAFDFDEAIMNGTPRAVAEQQAICELQAIVAENVRRLGTKALNTPGIATQCRRLMLAYNLGQRLFAKIVLNQSQGSLSELLSKPRPWQRLTEKGREAFRRIFAWVSDERAITLLRVLSPRRMASATGRNEKIEQPSVESLIDSSPCASSPPFCTSPVPSAAESCVQRAIGIFTSPTVSADVTQSVTKQNSRWKHDDIPRDKIMEIYEREMVKLREQEATLENAMRSRPASSRSNERRPQSGCSNSIRKLEQLASNPISPGSAVFTPSNPNTRSLKTGLPPISQEQFEQISTLDTDALVQTIKEFLSQNSISQRQFGEHVLGLSQGSVSDLLARPKPWNMLTQKGREPFIRMQMFLDDKNAVDQLKSRRSCESTQPLQENTPRLSRTSSNSSAASLTGLTSDIVPLTVDSIYGNALDGLVVPSSPDSNPLPELNTYQIARQVKEILHANGIGQKTFGEAVLSVSQGTVSDLLSKPKHWSGLSLRGREPYLRMQQWLQDPQKLDVFTNITNGTPSPVKRPAPDTPPCDLPKKAQRTVITEQQRSALRFAFAHDPHPTSRTIEFLAKELGLSARTVVNWFYNHRTRLKFNGEQQDEPNAMPVPSIFENSKATINGVETQDEWREGLQHLISMFSEDDRSAAVIEEPSSPTSEFSTKPAEPQSDGSGALAKAVAKMKEMAAANAGGPGLSPACDK